MKRLSLALGAVVFAASLPTLAQQTPPTSSGAPQRLAQDGYQGPVVWVNTDVVNATVSEIDHARRALRARTEDGSTLSLAVGADVNNFHNLKQGDQVTIRYTEAEAVALAKHSGAEQETGEIRSKVESFAAAQHAPGAAVRPGVGATERTTVVANVFDIDRERGILTLRGTSGDPVQIRANPQALQQLNQNDQIVISYVQATAVEIEPGNRARAAASGRSGGAANRDANR